MPSAKIALFSVANSTQTMRNATLAFTPQTTGTPLIMGICLPHQRVATKLRNESRIMLLSVVRNVVFVAVPMALVVLSVLAIFQSRRACWQQIGSRPCHQCTRIKC